MFMCPGSEETQDEPNVPKFMSCANNLVSRLRYFRLNT